MATPRKTRELSLSFGADNTMKAIRKKVVDVLSILEKAGLVVTVANFMVVQEKVKLITAAAPVRTARRMRQVRSVPAPVDSFPEVEI